VALGAVFTVTAWIFAGVGAVAAQISGGARGARTLAILVLGLSYVLRMAGDVSALGGGGLEWLAWLSPFGWGHRAFPFGADDWWPVALGVLCAVLTAAGAGYLRTRRDLGGGLLAGRLGPASAAASLRSPIALAWRLHRGLLVGWTAGFAALGMIFGAVAGSVAALAEDSAGVGDVFARIGGTSAVLDGYFATVAPICGVIAACYAVQAALRLRDEEQAGHAEAILSTDVSRFAWAGSHLVFALTGPAVALLAEGLLAGLVHGDVAPMVNAAVVQIPAVWVLAGLAMLLIGVLPRLASLAWAAIAGCLALMMAGPLLELDQWVLDVSPFAHVPRLPAVAFTGVPLLVLTVIAAVLGGAGLIALRRRDVPV